MIGVFIIEKFLNKKRVKAKSKLAPDVHGVFYLPPLNRKDTSDIAVDDEFFGVLDDVAAHTLTISLTREGTYKQFSKLQAGEEPLSFSYRGTSYAFSAKPAASVKDVRKRAIAVALRSSAQL